MNAAILGSGFGLYGYLPALQALGCRVVLPLRYRSIIENRAELSGFAERIGWAADDTDAIDQADAVVVARRPADQSHLFNMVPLDNAQGCNGLGWRFRDGERGSGHRGARERVHVVRGRGETVRAFERDRAEIFVAPVEEDPEAPEEVVLDRAFDHRRPTWGSPFAPSSSALARSDAWSRWLRPRIRRTRRWCHRRATK